MSNLDAPSRMNLLSRRLAALCYDSLLFAALAIVCFGGLTLLRTTTGSELGTPWKEAVLYLVGLLFFAGFWARGGQTLGLRAWRLQVQRLDGRPLSFAHAALRYTAGLLPILAALWCYKQFGSVGTSVVALAYVPCLLDRRGRAFNDWVAATEVVVLPKS